MNTTHSTASCCVCLLSCSRWAPASLWPSPTSCSQARTTAGGGEVFLAPAPLASLYFFTLSSTTTIAPTWAALYRAWNSSDILCSLRLFSRSCWEQSPSGLLWLLFVTSTVALRWTDGCFLSKCPLPPSNGEWDSWTSSSWIPAWAGFVLLKYIKLSMPI